MKIPLFSLEEILENRERERLHFHLSRSITESLCMTENYKSVSLESMKR